MKNLIKILVLLSFLFQLESCCPDDDNLDPLDADVIAAAENGTLNTGGSGGSGTTFKPGSMTNIVCTGVGPNPAKNVHCLAVGSAIAPHYYGNTSVFGGSDLVGTSWRNSIGCEMYLGSGGNGTFKANPSASTRSIKWGALINSNGSSPGGNGSLYITAVESDYGDLIDAQFGSGVYYTGSGSWSNGWY